MKENLDATAVDNEVKEYKLSDERRKLLTAETYGGVKPLPLTQPEVDDWLPQYEQIKDQY